MALNKLYTYTDSTTRERKNDKSIRHVSAEADSAVSSGKENFLHTFNAGTVNEWYVMKKNCDKIRNKRKRRSLHSLVATTYHNAVQ